MATAKQAPARPSARKHAATPLRADAPLPSTRVELLVLHEAARRRRDAAPIESHERAAAAFEIERIEIQIARIERAMDPPLV